MSVFKNFRKEELEYWKGEWEIDVEEFGEERTFEQFMEDIWESSPFNPESENYGEFLPRMKYNFDNALTIPKSSGLTSVAMRCWWASRVNYHCSKDHHNRLRKWCRSSKTGEMMSRHYKCFKI